MSKPNIPYPGNAKGVLGRRGIVVRTCSAPSQPVQTHSNAAEQATFCCGQSRTGSKILRHRFWKATVCCLFLFMFVTSKGQS